MAFGYCVDCKFFRSSHNDLGWGCANPPPKVSELYKQFWEKMFGATCDFRQPETKASDNISDPDLMIVIGCEEFEPAKADE